MLNLVNKLGENIQAFTSMFDSVKDPVYLMKYVGDAFQYIYANKSALEHLGKKEAQVTGRFIEEVVSMDLGEKLNHYYKKAINTCQPVIFETSMKKDNNLIIGETLLNPIVMKDEPCQYVLAIVRDITERQCKEHELQEIKRKLEKNQERLSSIFKHNSEAVIELDLNGIIISINDKCYEISGYKAQDIVGKDFRELIVKENLEETIHHTKPVVQGKTVQYETWIYKKCGEKALIEVKNIPIFVSGKVVGIYGIAKDITKKRSMEKELEKVRNELELVWNHVYDSIFILSEEGNILKVNPSFERMFGYQLKELPDCDMVPLVSPQDKKEQMQILESLKQGETINNLEVQRWTKIGEKINILASYRPIRKNGILAVGVYRDISERKRIIDKLIDSEKRYRSLVDLSPDPIIVHRSGVIKYVNKAAIKLINGKNYYQLVNQSIFDFLPKPDIDKIKKGLNRIMKNKIDNDDIEPTIQPIMKLNGEKVDTEITSIAVEFDGEPAIHSIIRDISGRIKEKEELEYLAYHDPLTGLKNRRAFIDRLDEAIEANKLNDNRLAVIYLDMDDFKSINDKYGHGVGDELLKQFAMRLRKNVRKSDVLCRIGGDEFLILLNDVKNKQHVIDVADRIYETTQAPYSVESYHFHMTTSFGISFYPKDATNAKLLINQADIALYKAKQERNKYEFF